MSVWSTTALAAPAWGSAAAAAVAAALLVRPRPADPDRLAPDATAPPVAPAAAVGWLHRHRLLWCALAGVGTTVFVAGAAGLPLGVVAAVATWVVIGRAEPRSTRLRREAVRRDLPHLVALLGATLRAGAAPGEGLTAACAALPGAAADRLGPVAARLALGLDPVQVWSGLEGDAELAPLGRALARAQSTGAPVVAAVDRLADDLLRAAAAQTEERARAVGVQAAVPLGLCLLPAFVLIGIVPLVVALLTGLDL